MTDSDFKKFLAKDFCHEGDLFELSEEQMNLVANTNIETRSYYSERAAAQASGRYFKKKASLSEQQAL